MELLRPLIQKSVEELKLQFSEVEYYGINVTTVLNGLTEIKFKKIAMMVWNIGNDQAESIALDLVTGGIGAKIDRLSSTKGLPWDERWKY